MFNDGEQIGPYTIESELGQGGMATVYKAYHARLDRHVAIKVMHQSLMRDSTFLSRFEREARIIANLEHSNIVPVHDFSDHEGKPYLVMKYVEGQTLEDVLREGALPLAEILRIVSAVADALTYAHEQGVLHRDIKPSNIIIDGEGTAYLTDFGLARLARQGASSLSQGMMIGTPHYISPEQALGKIELDPRTDVYSLGVLLYELVVGCVPYTGESAFAIVHDHIYTLLPMPRQINPEVPEEVEGVLVKALQKDPDSRYETPTLMMNAFRQAIKVSGLEKLSQNRSFVAAKALETFETQKSGAAPLVVPAADGIPAPAPVASIPSQLPPVEMPPVDDPTDPVGLHKPESDIDLSGLQEFGDWGNRLASFIQEQVEQHGSPHTWDAWDKWGAGDDEEDEEPATEEERIRRFVKKRNEERIGFYSHLAAFVFGNIILWLIWGFLGGTLGGICAFPWASIATLGWGIGLVAHIIDYSNKYGRGAERREREVRRELARARRAKFADYDDETYIIKAKNEDLEDVEDRRVRLAADGELTESFVEDLQDSPGKTKRQS